MGAGSTRAREHEMLSSSCWTRLSTFAAILESVFSWSFPSFCPRTGSPFSPLGPNVSCYYPLEAKKSTLVPSDPCSTCLPSTHSLTAPSNLRHPFPGFKSPITPRSSPPHSFPDTHISRAQDPSWPYPFPSPRPPSTQMPSQAREAPTLLSTSPFVHTRSHSFTPRLPSKLTPRAGPVSPKRKGSSGSG
jgi:hypothetical protein